MAITRTPLQYHHLVQTHDIPRLDSTGRKRIKKTIEEKLTTKPELFGTPLRKSMKGYRKLRVGDYRVVFTIRGAIVSILLIEHRSIVYREMEKRLT